MEFSKNLKFFRNSAELTQRQLAERLNLSANTVCEWEKGRSEPSIATIKKLTEIFNISVDCLLGLEDETGANAVTTAPVLGGYSSEERQLVANFRELNQSGKRLINETIKTLLTTAGGSGQNKNNGAV